MIPAPINHEKRRKTLFRKYKERERDIIAPESAWHQAISRIPQEREQGCDSLSLMLLLFESVFEIRADEETSEPWNDYWLKMCKPQGKQLDNFEVSLATKLTKPANSAA